MKKLALFLLLAILGVSASAQAPAQGFDISNYGVTIEPDSRLIAVLATLEMARTTNAAGETVSVINTPLSAEGKEFRDLLKSDSAALDSDLRNRISQFVIQYKKRNPNASDAEIVAPFISMAYSLSPAPDLADPVVTSDLPGNLLDVLDFAPLVREFYRRSSFSANLPEYLKRYQSAADASLRPSTREMVRELLDYLNTRPQTVYAERIKTREQKTKRTALEKVEVREHDRRFVIVPEMLAPAGNLNFLNIRDDYYLILPPDTNVTDSIARRAFLQYVIDPMILANAKEIAAAAPGIKALLEERRKTNSSISPDIYRAVARSLIAAVDARQLEYAASRIATDKARQKIAQQKTDAEKLAVSAELKKFNGALSDETALRLSEDYENGAVLAFYFTDQLKGFEGSGFDISASVKEMILSLDPIKEANRLEQTADARRRALAARESAKTGTPVAVIAENPVTTRLREIQKTIDAKNYIKANADLTQLLAANPGEPRIHYNLGRVASFSAELLTDPEAQRAKLLEAKTAYENVLKSAAPGTDAALISLSYVALGKIYEFYDDPEYAVKIYDAAIKVGDVAGGAYSEAIAAKQRLMKNQ